MTLEHDQGARAIRQPGRGKLIPVPDYPKLIQKQARARICIIGVCCFEAGASPAAHCPAAAAAARCLCLNELGKNIKMSPNGQAKRTCFVKAWRTVLDGDGAAPPVAAPKSLGKPTA